MTMEPDRLALLALGTRRHFTRGQALMHEGDLGRDVFVLVHGCVKVFGDAYDGRMTLLAIRVGGDILGELSALDGGPRSATIVAAVPTVAKVIGREVFDGYLGDRPQAANAVRKSIAAKLRQATRFRIDLGGAPVLVRLARTLYQLAVAYGRQNPQGTLVDVPLSQVELAALVGAAEPSVQRALAELRRMGLLTTGYRLLVISDMDGLRSLATEHPAH